MGASSAVQIANLALDMVGTRSMIASLSENSPEARAINLHYVPSVRAVLQAAHWNFARKQQTLAVLKDGTVTPSQNVPVPWLYEYAYPSDCIQAIYIMPLTQSAPGAVPGTPAFPYWQNVPQRFLVSSDVDVNGNPNKVILANSPMALLVYTADIESPALFDDTFVQALSAYIGHRICLRLAGDKARSNALFQMADRITRDARASNGNEGLTVIDNVPDWTRVRGYLSDWAYPMQGSGFWFGPSNLSMVT